MIDSILPYIDDYENIRVATGLNEKELPDSSIDLAIYINTLGLTLTGTSGIYAPSVIEQTLEAMFDTLPDTDPMYANIQLLSIYTVADAVLDSVGLKAWKTQSDGKSSIGRFAPESTYLGTKENIQKNLKAVTDRINALLSAETVESVPLLSVVKPASDPVTEY